MDYKFYFNNAKDSKYFYERAYEIAKKYGTVRLSDLCDLIGVPCNYLANEVIWTEDSVSDAQYNFDDCSMDEYCMRFPEPDQYPAQMRGPYKFYSHPDSRSNPAGKRNQRQSGFHFPRSTVVPKKTPESLNITIIMDPSKDPYSTIREVIQQANEIKERPVFITIS